MYILGLSMHYARGLPAPRYDPLKVYVNDEGLVRFATEQYSDSVETLQSRRLQGVGSFQMQKRA